MAQTQYSIAFSPTGGTAKVMENILKGYGEATKEIDVLKNSTVSFTKDDVCFVGVPSYGGRVPAFCAEKLKQYQGNGAKAVLVVVYGNRDYEDTLVELQDIMTAQGFQPVAAITAIAEHSVVRTIAQGRPDNQDAQKLQEFGKTIREQHPTAIYDIKGNRPYKQVKPFPMKPKTDESTCTHCGICAENCPVGAITIDKKVETDNQKCISCMRCIAVCPVKARALDKMVLFAVSTALNKACATRKEPELFL